MRFKKIYLEISNVCNLNCSFCPKTKRKPHIMTPDEFRAIAPKLRTHTEFLYFHLLGEPLCHPELEKFLNIAEEFSFRVIITTNGTLLDKKSELLLSSAALHKINISLHAFEANDLNIPFDEYLDSCFEFAKAAEGKKIVVLRLWNRGGLDTLNENITMRLKAFFDGEWVRERHGTRIGEKIYVEKGDKFDWPDATLAEGSDKVFCYGLSDQLGILADGTVVPCCLDSDGNIPLGNIFESDIDTILRTKRATDIYDGFCRGYAAESLCRKCGYARRFNK